MNIYKNLISCISQKGGAFLVLLDPDKLSVQELPHFVRHCQASGADGFLVGGSLLTGGEFFNFIKVLKESSSVPVIIFPGDVNQISPDADAILFLSVVSGRNAEHLIGKHVIAAPAIKRAAIEPISTGYIIVESGSVTTAQYMSGSPPIPRNKPEIAAATALAAEYLGFKCIYLEAGSGANQSVPAEMIKAVSRVCSIPIIVGGGIKTVEDVREKMEAGGNIIVTGNFFEDEDNLDLIKYFAGAVHTKLSVKV
jgi:phosphoglycerol geranylgeranyltransferase